MKIKFVDLYNQYRNNKSEIDSSIKKVISSSDFINGKSVRKFENNFKDLKKKNNKKNCWNYCCSFIWPTL